MVCYAMRLHATCMTNTFDGKKMSVHTTCMCAFSSFGKFFLIQCEKQTQGACHICEFYISIRTLLTLKGPIASVRYAPGINETYLGKQQ